MNNKHPEQKKDELFLGNTTQEDMHKSSWITSRLGKIAYDINNTEIKDSGLYPWFIKAQEVKNKIVSLKDNNSIPNFKERVNIFTTMLTEQGFTVE